MRGEEGLKLERVKVAEISHDEGHHGKIGEFPPVLLRLDVARVEISVKRGQFALLYLGVEYVGDGEGLRDSGEGEEERDEGIRGDLVGGVPKQNDVPARVCVSSAQFNSIHYLSTTVEKPTFAGPPLAPWISPL